MMGLLKNKIKAIGVLCGLLICLCLTAVLLLFPGARRNAYAFGYDSFYTEFLYFADGVHYYVANLGYVSSVDSPWTAENFDMKLYTTDLTWSIFGPSFNNVNVTLHRPDGSTRSHAITPGIPQTLFQETFFSTDDLKDGSGNWVEGTYTVKASGNLVGLTSQAQTASFTFHVNIYAPEITLTANDSKLKEIITNSDVTVTATDTDGISRLEYGRSTTSSYVTPNTEMLNGRVLTSEGMYSVKATDHNGRSTSRSFIIDKTAPTLTLQGVTDGGITRGDVRAVWSTEVGGVGAQLVSRTEDRLTVKYSRSTTSAFPTSATTDYTSGTSLTAEGNYLMTITDKAGNSTSYTFTIDKSAPTLSLKGVTDGGFTQSAVKAEWETEIGGVGAQLANAKDALTVKYSYSTTAAFPTAAKTDYSKGTSLTKEGNYLMTITDKAGNERRYTFSIDTVAPTLSMSDVADGGFTKDDVDLVWETAAGGVGAQCMNANDKLSVFYARSATSEFPTFAETEYTGTLTEEGNYFVLIRDRAGNSTSYTFTIDKTAPTLSLQGVTDDGATNGDVALSWATETGGVGAQLINAKDALTVKYAYSDGSYPDAVQRLYTGQLTAQGWYLVAISDLAGNCTKYHFIIDKTAPVLRVNADMVGVELVYGGTPRVTWEDNYLSVSEVRITCAALDVGTQSITVGAVTDIGLSDGDVLQKNGVYTVTLTDDVGNVSSTTFAVVGAVNSYNHEQLTGSGYLKTGNYRVKIPYMKSVTVPAKGKDEKATAYPGTWSNANTYVFASYENALRFMTEIEMEEAVTANGNGMYTYYQLNNHSVTTTYGQGGRATMEEFYAALEKYASAYVSAYSVPSLSSPYIGSNTVIMDAEVLAGTTEDGVQRIGGDYVFKDKDYSFEYNGHTFAYSALAALKIAQGEGKTVYDGVLRASETFLGYVGSGSASGTSGGVYTVTETDSLGNTFTYLVYFDRTAPTFLAEYTYYHAYTDKDGDMQTEVLTEELELSSNLQIDGNLRSLRILQLFDNADKIVTAVVVLPDGTVFTAADLSALTFGADGNYTDGGEYHVRLYDRTGNLFDYVFTIYGGAPRVQTQIRGTGDNRSMTLTFANANSYSSIVRFAIYRYGTRLPEGEYVESVDGKVLNTLYIEQSTWSYRFLLGGVYTVRFEDSFGNVTDSEEIVFSKGLPEYTLSGVADGGKTRKSVTLAFENSAGYEALRNGEPVLLPVTDTLNGQTIEIPATAENNGTWEVKLYVRSDPDTYVIVRFAIDTVAPTASAEDADGTRIGWETTTREGFRIVWQDTDVARVRYQIDSGTLKTYTAGELLTQDGVYTVTITDDVGNSSTYSITRDTKVDHKLNFNGTNIEQGGVFYVRGGFSVTNGEWLQMTIYRDGSAIEAPRFSYEYITEGVYEIALTDGVGNVAELTVVIDKTAPEIIFRRGEDAYEPVTVEVESGDVAAMTVRKDGKAYDVELADEMTFSAWGTYEITLKDVLGNACTETFTISKIPPKVEIFTTGGETVADGGATNGSVYVVWDDADATARITLPDGMSRTYTAKTVLVDEGTYTIRVTDTAKNVVSVTVTILRTVSYDLIGADGAKFEPVWMNGMLHAAQDFVVTFGTNVAVTATKDGAPYSYASGQLVTADAVYEFCLTDTVGNRETIVIRHDVTPPAAEVVTGAEATDAVTVRLSEADAVVRLTHVAAGNRFSAELTGKTQYIFEDWGEYTLEISDALGNTVIKTFTIAKLPPQINVMTTAGILVKDGACINSPVYIECDEENTVIRYRVGGDSISRIYKSGTVLSGQGVYEVTATDIAGTTVTLHFTLDSEVLIEAWLDGEFVRTLGDRLAGREYIDFEFGEDLTLDCRRNGVLYRVTAEGGTLRISEEGDYILTLTDGVGNVLTVEFVIDRTAPVFSVSTDEAVTKDDVAVILEDLSDVESYKLTENGRKSNNFVLSALNTFDAEAEYVLTLADALGNSASATFTIRRTIAYVLNIPEGFMTADGAILTLRQSDVTVRAERDGADAEAKAENGAYTFTADGEYLLTLEDALGNIVMLTFTIESNPYTAKFEYTIPRDSTCKLVSDGVTLPEGEYVQGDKIVVTKDGEYTLTLRRGGRTGMFTFIVDTMLPALVLNGTEYASGDFIPNLKADFTIAANKTACTIEVFYNGASVPYSTDAQSANGRYKVVITDAVGNVATYEFQKDFTFNAGAIALFSVGGAAVVLVVLLLLRRRIKMRIR